jgi:hypothetical protein
MRALMLATGLFLAAALAGGMQAAATSFDPATPGDLCVVRVEDTAPQFSIEADQPARYIAAVRSFPNSSLVLAAPFNRPGTWEITRDHRYARVTEGDPPRDAAVSPDPFWNPFEEEAHSRRTLAVGGRGLWQLPPGAMRFVPLRPEQWSVVQPIFSDSLRYVAAWQATVLVGRRGLFLISGDAPLQPILGPGGDRLDDVRRIAPVPGRGALLVQMQNGSVALVTGETGPERVRWLFRYAPWWMPGFLAEAPSARRHRSTDAREFLDAVLPQPAPDTFLIRSAYSGHLLTLPRNGSEPTVTLVERQAERSFGRYRRLAPGTQDYLVHVQSSWDLNWVFRPGLYRLDGTRFVAVPGATGGGFGRLVRPVDLPSRGYVALLGNDGPLTVYRDRLALPVPDSEALLGSGLRTAHDLPSIGRVVLRSPRGFYELTHEPRLRPLEVSGPTPRWGTVRDMPDSGIGVVLSAEGIHLIGPEGGLVHLPQTSGLNADASGAAHYLPSRRELVFAGPRNGLFLLVDRRLSGAAACAHAERS